jgi:hypothetical protein
MTNTKGEQVTDISLEDMKEIWDHSQDHHDMIKLAYELGFRRGQLEQAKAVDPIFRAVLNVIEKQEGDNAAI